MKISFKPSDHVPTESCQTSPENCSRCLCGICLEQTKDPWDHEATARSLTAEKVYHTYCKTCLVAHHQTLQAQGREPFCALCKQPAVSLAPPESQIKKILTISMGIFGIVASGVLGAAAFSYLAKDLSSEDYYYPKMVAVSSLCAVGATAFLIIGRVALNEAAEMALGGGERISPAEALALARD